MNHLNNTELASPSKIILNQQASYTEGENEISTTVLINKKLHLPFASREQARSAVVTEFLQNEFDSMIQAGKSMAVHTLFRAALDKWNSGNSPYTLAKKHGFALVGANQFMSNYGLSGSMDDLSKIYGSPIDKIMKLVLRSNVELPARIDPNTPVAKIDGTYCIQPGSIEPLNIESFMKIQGEIARDFANYIRDTFFSTELIIDLVKHGMSSAILPQEKFCITEINEKHIAVSLKEYGETKKKTRVFEISFSQTFETGMLSRLLIATGKNNEEFNRICAQYVPNEHLKYPIILKEAFAKPPRQTVGAHTEGSRH